MSYSWWYFNHITLIQSNLIRSNYGCLWVKTIGFTLNWTFNSRPSEHCKQYFNNRKIRRGDERTVHSFPLEGFPLEELLTQLARQLQGLNCSHCSKWVSTCRGSPCTNPLTVLTSNTVCSRKTQVGGFTFKNQTRPLKTRNWHAWHKCTFHNRCVVILPAQTEFKNRLCEFITSVLKEPCLVAKGIMTPLRNGKILNLNWTHVGKPGWPWKPAEALQEQKESNRDYTKDTPWAKCIHLFNFISSLLNLDKLK